MKPQNLKTKIFLDSGDPAETRAALNVLGFLDGQTTNPSLIAKSPEAQARLRDGKKFSETEAYEFYLGVVTQVSGLIPNGSVSIEVYADSQTTADKMFEQGKQFFSWIPNAHIKFPTTASGLEAAEKSVKAGLRVNMTLCFTQDQAAAVYIATIGAKAGDVFISPFIGRLDDRGENGMDLIANIIKMYKPADGHVSVLAASVRTMDHFYEALALGSDIITAPFKILKNWSEDGLKLPPSNFSYDTKALESIPYKDLDLNQNWKNYNINDPLTDKGIEKFTNDWYSFIK